MKVIKQAWLIEFPKTGINPTRIRGYFGNMNREDSNYHNHDVDGKTLYRMPPVQYRNLKDKDQIFSMIEPTSFLRTNKINNVVIHNIKLEKIDIDLGVSIEPKVYEFLTPYMMNKNNYNKYIINKDKKVIEKSIVGNLISLSKEFNYQINDHIYVNIKSIKEVNRVMKGMNVLCFYATFESNYQIPNYVAIGRQRSFGMGVVHVK